jgi:hypothetical protein
MKNILVRYLKENKNYHTVLNSILSKSMSGKEPFAFAVGKLNNDEFVKKLNNVVDLGIYESINNLKQSDTLKKNVDVRNRAINIQNAVVVNEDVTIAPQFLKFLESNIYDSAFKAEYDILVEKLNENKRFMALSHYYLTLESDLYKTAKVNDVAGILFEMLVNDNESNEARFLNAASGVDYNANIAKTKNFLITEKANLSLEQKDFVVTNVSGIYEQVSENEYILHTEGRDLILNDKDNTVKDRDADYQYTPTNEFLSLSKLLDKGLITLTETVNVNANKLISISDDTKKVYVDGKEVKVMENNIPYTLLTKYGIDKKFIPTFTYVYENLNKFVAFDTAKKIQHKHNNSLNVVVFKMNESLYAFKNNQKVAVRYITEQYEPSELRKIVLEFIQFDIKKDVEIFETLFIKEAQAEKEKSGILAQIQKLEEELEKIETAESEEELDDESIAEVKKIIMENLNNLRQEYKSIKERVSLDDFIEVNVKGKNGLFYVEAAEYTSKGKNEDLTVVDEDNNKTNVKKKDVKPIDSI